MVELVISIDGVYELQMIGGGGFVDSSMRGKVVYWPSGVHIDTICWIIMIGGVDFVVWGNIVVVRWVRTGVVDIEWLGRGIVVFVLYEVTIYRVYFVIWRGIVVVRRGVVVVRGGVDSFVVDRFTIITIWGILVVISHQKGGMGGLKMIKRGVKARKQLTVVKDVWGSRQSMKTCNDE
jgi:hypothetical protein